MRAWLFLRNFLSSFLSFSILRLNSASARDGHQAISHCEASLDAGEEAFLQKHKSPADAFVQWFATADF